MELHFGVEDGGTLREPAEVGHRAWEDKDGPTDGIEAVALAGGHQGKVGRHAVAACLKGVSEGRGDAVDRSVGCKEHPTPLRDTLGTVDKVQRRGRATDEHGVGDKGRQTVEVIVRSQVECGITRREGDMNHTVAVVDGIEHRVDDGRASVVDTTVDIALIGTDDDGVGSVISGVHSKDKVDRGIATHGIEADGARRVGAVDGVGLATPRNTVAHYRNGVARRSGPDIELQHIETVAGLVGHIDKLIVLSRSIIRLTEEGVILIVADGGDRGVGGYHTGGQF